VSAAPLVSVVIPERNEARHIEACLAAVFGQDYPGDRLEVIVVDGVSTDGTREILDRAAARDPRVRLLDNPARIVPTAMNRGIAAARGAIVVRVDGHCIIQRDYVSRVVETLRRTGADGVGGTMSPVARTPFQGAVALATSTPFGVGNSAFHYAAQERESDSVYLGAYPAATFARWGGYDETLVRNQDDELNYRIRARGGRIVLNPDIRSSYTPRGTLRSLFSQYFQYGWWKPHVFVRVPRMISWRHLGPSAFVVVLMLLAAAGFFTPIAWGLLAAGLAAHAAGSTAFCVGRPSPVPGLAAWRSVILVPLATLAMHVAYGLGLLLSLPGALLAGRPAPAPPILKGAPEER
jgi:glycosyltransferase involved in cell wall biosynthesis